MINQEMGMNKKWFSRTFVFVDALAKINSLEK